MRILIIKTSSLGDIVQSYPALEYLREKFPQATIDWVVEERAKSLINAHPFVNNAFVIDTKKWKKALFSKKTLSEIASFKKKLSENTYDVVFDLQGNIKSGLILAMTKARAKVGFRKPAEFPNRFFTSVKVSPPPRRNVRQDYLFLVQSFFNDFSLPQEKGPLLQLTENEKTELQTILASLPPQRMLIAPAAFWPNKEISDEKLIALLKTYPTYFLFIAASDRERLRAQRLAHSFKERSLVLDALSIPLLQHLMSHVDCVIAMDSFPLHLAGSIQAPTLGFFGPTLASKYAPQNSSGKVIQGACPYGVTFEKRCPRLRTCPTGACLKEIL